MSIQFTKKESDIRCMKTVQFLLVLTLLVSSASYLPAQSNDSQSEQIAPELVGRWCFIDLSRSTMDAISNSCITLNEDGTFEAVLDRKMLPNANSFSNLQDSDYGKWWVTGNRIFYNSPSNGQGSFTFQKMNHPRLENTPMVVLNGIAFATASSHEPW
jgi:hypothetical protein